MCCKLPKTPELNKEMGKWCPHCAKPGCKIWETRPQVCRDFQCVWLASPTMPNKYRPDKVKMYVCRTNDPEIMQVFVDPSFPTAWLKEPGKDIVEVIRKQGRHMVIVCGEQNYFIKGAGKEVPKLIQEAIFSGNLEKY